MAASLRRNHFNTISFGIFLLNPNMHMIKQSVLFLSFFCVTIFAFAQDDIPVKALPTEIFRPVKKATDTDTMKWDWKRGGLVSLNIAQGSLSNWAAGGDNFSLAVNSYLNYFMWHKQGKHTWDSNLDVYFGFVQTTSLGKRKNDDRIDFISKYGYNIDTLQKLYLSTLFDFRTQFFDGYTYMGDSGTLSSTLLSPAYMFLSQGFDYKGLKNFSIFISPVTGRWTIVASNRLTGKGLYGVPGTQHSVLELGAFASVNYASAVMKNVSYHGRMDLFSNYQQKPGNVDMFFTNMLAFKINKYLSASYNLDMVYDDDVKLFGPSKNSPGLQLKSLIGIGFAMPISSVSN